MRTGINLLAALSLLAVAVSCQKTAPAPSAATSDRIVLDVPQMV